MTVLIAAYNEEAGIEQTIAAILAQDYAGAVSVLVIDDGSSDGTRDVVRRLADPAEHVSLIEAEHGGKAAALNLGLARASTPLIATVDADTLLVPTALGRIVTRLLIDPEGTDAVAGSVLVRNSRGGLVARMRPDLGVSSTSRIHPPSTRPPPFVQTSSRTVPSATSDPSGTSSRRHARPALRATSTVSSSCCRT